MLTRVNGKVAKTTREAKVAARATGTKERTIGLQVVERPPAKEIGPKESLEKEVEKETTNHPMATGTLGPIMAQEVQVVERPPAREAGRFKDTAVAAENGDTRNVTAPT